MIAATARIDPATPAADLIPREVPQDHPKARSVARHHALLRALQLLVALAFFARAQVHPPDDPSALRFWLVARFRVLGQLALLTRPGVISDNYFCRLATITSAGGSAVRTACATVRS